MKVLFTVFAAASAFALVFADSDGGKKCKIGSTKPKDKCPAAQVCVADTGRVGKCHLKCDTGVEKSCPDGYNCEALGDKPGGAGYCELDVCPEIEAMAKKGYESVAGTIVVHYEEVLGDYYKSVVKSVINNGYKGCVVNSEVMDEMCMKPGTFCFSADEEDNDSGFCAESAHWCTIGQKDACPGAWMCMGSTKSKKGDIGLCAAKDVKKCSVGTENPCGTDMMCEELPGQDGLEGAEGICEESPCEGEAHHYWTFQGWVAFADVEAYEYGLPEESQMAVKKAIDDL